MTYYKREFENGWIALSLCTCTLILDLSYPLSAKKLVQPDKELVMILM
jgi:hypothetical protein